MPSESPEWQPMRQAYDYRGPVTSRLVARYCALAGHRWGMTADWHTGIQRCRRCGRLMGEPNTMDDARQFPGRDLWPLPPSIDEQLASRRAQISVYCCACGGEFPGTTQLHNGICDECQKLTHGPNYRLIAELNRKAEEVERLRKAIRDHRDRVTRAQEEHGPPINALDEIDTDLWRALDG